MSKAVITLIILFTGISGSAQFGFQRYDTIDVVKSSVQKLYPWAGGMDYCQFSNIDLNYDGTEDLFVFDRTCNKVLTFIQTGAPGTPNYIYAPEYESQFPDDLHDWVLLVDYNCDGKKDIFSYAIGGTRVWANTGNSGSGLSFVQTSQILKTWLWGSYGYIYTSSVDIPGILDIDGDGDIDMLSFSVGGTTVEYHKNLSMETYGICDSLLYETKNRCWGRFKENGSTNALTLWDTLSDPCDEDPLMIEEMVVPYRPEINEDRHSGSSILALDMNGNGVMELVLGDISYPGMILLNNSGTTPNTNSGMDAQFSGFPLSSVPIDITIFPAGYHVDINNDGIRDLMAAPNSKIGSENRIGSWYYENMGSDNVPDFQFVKDDFLQGDMIDQGSGALPVFFDHNGDGLKDLLVSCHGQFDTVSGNQKSRISYYENTGTAGNPEFTFITDDYQNISQMGIGTSLVFYPTFGDLDGDGDEDMILGEYSGYCYYLENTGGAGNAAIFNTFILLNDDTATPIFDGTYAFPSLVDLDRDNDIDLVIGRRNGKLFYYENVGTTSSYSFQLITNELGAVDVSEYWTIEGHAIPQFVDVDTNYHLILGAKNGYIHYYDNIDGNLSGSFTLIDSTLEDIHIGTFSAPTIYDVDNDNRFELVLGNQRGGVALYKSGIISDIGIYENEVVYEFGLYPNPADESFIVDLKGISENELVQLKITIYDLSGRLVQTINPSSDLIIINSDDMSNGTYLVEVRGDNGVSYKKIVIQ